MAGKHSEVLARTPEIELTRICSTERSVGNAAELKDRHGYRHVTTDFDALLADDVDVVYLCTPDGTHAGYASRSISAGKHVFSEKPLGRSAEELASVQAALETSDITLQVGMNCRYRSRYVAFKSALDGLGELRYLRGTYVMNVVETVRTREKPWWVDDAAGPLTFLHGGGLHALDLMRWFAGEVASVSALATALELEQEWGLDTFLVQLTFESGALGELLVSAAAPVANDFGFEAWTDKESLRDGEAEQDVPDLELQLRDFLEAIGSGGPPPSSLADALANFSVIEAVGRSIESGESAPVTAQAVETNP
jgi:predicted dehydrogenase